MAKPDNRLVSFLRGLVLYFLAFFCNRTFYLMFLYIDHKCVKKKIKKERYLGRFVKAS